MFVIYWSFWSDSVSSLTIGSHLCDVLATRLHTHNSVSRNNFNHIMFNNPSCDNDLIDVIYENDCW